MTSIEGRWLSLVGLGEDGWNGLSPAARAVVEQAELLVGGERHLALVPERPGQERLVWPRPFDAAYPLILERRGRAVCVLASGDPSWFGAGASLSRVVPANEMRVLPAPSAFSLAAAELAWPLQDAVCLTVCGRPIELVRPHLLPGAKLLVLSWDGTTPAALAALLTRHGFGGSKITVLENLGGPRQRVFAETAEAWNVSEAAALNTVAIEVVAGPDARPLPRTPGLPDDWFDSDGQITKREIRAVTLSLLAPRKNELLWDVGAGSGSIGIEWMLSDPTNSAIAIEPKAERAARIALNAATFGVPGLSVVHGRAPDALAGLAAPDAIFIGGGASEPGLLEHCWQALKPGGRLCGNAVTLEGEAALAAWMAKVGGDMMRISVSRAGPMGGFVGWRALSPVTLWRAEKP